MCYYIIRNDVNIWKILQIMLIVWGVISTIAYLFILGSNMNKSEEERRREDEDQIKYIDDYNERRQKRWKEIFIKAIFTMLN